MGLKYLWILSICLASVVPNSLILMYLRNWTNQSKPTDGKSDSSDIGLIDCLIFSVKHFVT